MGRGGAGIVAERANGVHQCRWQLGDPRVELGDGLRDTADGKGGMDAAKPGNADCASEIVIAVALL